MVEHCDLSGSDLNIKFRTILLTSIAVAGGVQVYVRT